MNQKATKRRKKLFRRSISLLLVFVLLMTQEGVGNNFWVAARAGAVEGKTKATGKKRSVANQEETKIQEILLTCKEYSLESVVLEWTMEENDKVVGYEIYRDGKLVDKINEQNFCDTEVTVADYTYMVTAVDAEDNIIAKSDNMLVTVRDSLTINTDYTLTENKVVKNLIITNGTLNLAGYELTVLGNIDQTGGTVTLDRGYLNCKGNYCLNYNGYLNMTNANDYVQVDGDMLWQPRYISSLTDGTLEVKGDFTQKVIYNDHNFTPGGKHTVLFSGTKKQTITFDTYYYNYFNILELENDSEEGIVCNGALPALKINRHDTKINLGIEGTEGMTLTEDTTIAEDVILLCGTLDLNGYHLTVQGNLIQLGGEVKPNGGKLEVSGDYYIEDKRNNKGTDTFARSFGILNMTDTNDYVKVGGNFEMGSVFDHTSYLTKGTLEVKGNVVQKTYYSPANLAMKGNSTLLLSGDEKQKMTFAAPALNQTRVRNLKITNKNGVTFESLIPVTGTVDDGGHVVTGTVGIGAGTEIVKDSFSGNLQILENKVLSKQLQINGNLSIYNATLDLNGQNVVVQGNVLADNSGTLYVNGGHLSCKGNLTIGSDYYYNYSYLTMNNEEDYVLVEGNFLAMGRNNSILTAGTLELKGNFTQKSVYDRTNFLTSGSHKTIFSGDKKQTIIFDSVSSGFQTVEILNESEEGIYAPSGMQTVNLIRNGNKIDTGAAGEYGWTLCKDEEWNNDLVLLADTLDLNGHTLTINGDLIQEGGTINVNNGTLIVNGNYYVQTKKENGTYNYSSGYLVMTNRSDVIQVNGDFVMGSTYSHSGKLTAGTLKVGGNFTQKTYNSAQNFATTKKFLLILNGSGKQEISFSNPSESRIANLKITNESTDGVWLGTQMIVTGNLNDCGNSIYGSASIAIGANTIIENNSFVSNLQIIEDKTISQELHIQGNLSITYGTTTLEKELTVDGGIIVSYATLNLNGQNVVVQGNVLADSSGTLYVNGGYLNCKGNLTIGSDYYYNYSYLTMNNEKDYVLVEGNFLAMGRNNSILTAGTLELKGDFTQKTVYDGNNFVASGSHKVIFSGDKKQSIIFDRPNSGFQTVEILNTSKEGIYAPFGLHAVEVIHHGNLINTGVHGEYGWTLTDDEVWNSDLVLIEDTLDLNGHTLRIQGDFIQLGGKVNINGGKLVVTGNYKLQNPNKDGSYNYSNGILIMTNEDDEVDVAGDFLMASMYSHSGKLTAGTLKVGGNFTQKTYNTNQNFATTKAFQLELNGSGKQEISFSNPFESKIANLKITNESTEGVWLGTQMVVTGNLNDCGNSIYGSTSVAIGANTIIENNSYAGNLQIIENKTISQELHVGGNLSITSGTTVLEKELTVDGDIIVSGATLNLNGQNMVVQGDTLVDSYGTLYINGGYLNCKGNLTIGPDYYYNYSYLTMDNVKDYVLVEGDFLARGRHNSTLTAGTLEIKGNFSQRTVYEGNNFVASNNHKIIFSGDKKQTITFNSTASGFNILEINNSGDDGVWTSASYINANEVILTKGKLHIGNNGIFGWTLQEDEVIEDNVYIINGDLDLAGHNLTINGNLCIAGGDVKVNGGTLNVEGDLRFQSITSAEGAAKITYGNSTGHLIMTDENDTVRVKKDFVMQSHKNHRGYLTAGVLECKGNFTQINVERENFAATGSHKTIFSGNEAQTITFANPGYSYFNELKIKNSSDAGVTLGSDMYVKNSLSDAEQKINKSYTTYIPTLDYLIENTFGGNLALTGHSTMSKNVVIGGLLTSSYNLNVNGCSLSADTLNINGGTFTVGGGNVTTTKNMNITGYSCFVMTNEEDYVTVAGNFTMDSYYSHNGRLTAGTLEIKGDFTQRTGYYYSTENFMATGTHNTILSGKAGTAGRNYIQVVNFANPGSSRFHTLTLVKSKNRYLFQNSIESICDELINKIEDEEPPTRVTGLTVTSKKANKISLTWDASEDDEEVTGYEIYRGNTKVATTTKTTYTDSGLTPNTTYVYKVYAFDAARNLSEASEAVSETTSEDNERPSAPEALKIKTRSGSSVTVCWNASTDNVKVDGYKIYRDGELLTTLGVATSYKDTNLDVDTLYSYQVSAIDTAGNESALSKEVKGSVQMPEITRCIPADQGQIGGNTVTLNVYYANAGNASGNKVQYEYKTENGWEKINSVLLGQRTYDSTTLYSTYTWDISRVKNGACEVRCTLYDEDGNTCVEEMTYYVDTEGPAAPESIEAVSENGVVTLKWMSSDSEDCAKYDIYRSVSNKSEYVKIGMVSGLNTTEYTDVNVTEGNTYYYKVKGIDGYNQAGEFSPVASVIIDKDLEAPTVTDISAKNNRVNGVADLTVTAEDNIGVTWVKLQYQDADGNWQDIGESEDICKGKAVISWDTTSLKDGDYNVRAYAKDAKGNITGTVVYEGKTMQYPLYTVRITVDNTGIEKIKISSATGYANYVTLKWNKVTEEDFGYFVVEQLIDGKFVQVENTGTTLGGHIKNLALEKEYTFRVVGYDDIGNRGVPSDSITVKTGKDVNPPVVKNFYPAEKYFNSTIPISIVATDDVGISSVKLEYSTDEKNWKDLTQKILEQPVKSYTYDYKFDVSDFKDGKVYVRVYVYDEEGNVSSYDGKPLSNTFHVDKTAPAAVKNFVAEGMDGYVTLDWSEPEEKDIASFRIYRAEEESGNYALLEKNIQSLRYYDRTAVYGIVYTYKIEVVDNAGNVSEMSNETVAQIKEDTEAPVIHAVSPEKGSHITGKTEIMAAVTDNVQIETVNFEYKAKNNAEDIWTELGTVEMHKSSGYPAVTLDASGLADGKYELRVVATDRNGNISPVYTVPYIVDGTAPKVSGLEATAGGFLVDLKWNKNNEEDFDYYAVYGKLGNVEEFSLLTKTTVNNYSHTGLKSGRKYQYKVIAYDEAGNAGTSQVVTAIPTAEDTQAPTAIVSETMSVRIGSELKADATASYDNVKITSYKWDFGDGTIVKQAIAKHKYKEIGKYKGSLTVSDAAGNKNTQEFTVHVRSRISTKVNINVKNVTNGNAYSMSYAYVYIEQDGFGTNYNADSFGELSVVLSAGTYTVKAFKEGYMPTTKTLKVSSGKEIDFNINLEKGELVTGKITTKRLTLEELVDLGVDLQDPSNWETHVYTFQYRTPDNPKMNTSTVYLSPNKTTKIYQHIENDGSSGSCYGTLTDVRGKRVVTIYNVQSYLKKMYEVDLQVTNHAEAGQGFDIINSQATLHLPKKLSLLKISGGQSLTNSMGTLEAQQTKSTTWYIRAEEAGSYPLSASFNGMLLPFEAPVKAEIKADDNLVVEEGEDNTFTDDGFITGNAEDYIIRVVNKNGSRVQGAIVTLSSGGKKCQTVTNGHGAARLEVNAGDTRCFNLSITCDGYLDYSESYYIDTTSYFDTITLFRIGEEEEEALDKNPYLDDRYAVKLTSIALDGTSITKNSVKINQAAFGVHALTFATDVSIDEYKICQGGKKISFGGGGTSFTACFQNSELKDNEAIYLQVRYKGSWLSYQLNINVVYKIYDVVQLYHDEKTADILTEAVSLSTSDKSDEIWITCKVAKLVGEESQLGDIVLVQDGKELGRITYPKKEFKLRIKDLKKELPVYLVTYNRSGIEISKDKLQLQVHGEIPKIEELYFDGEELKMSFGDDIPFLKGISLESEAEDEEGNTLPLNCRIPVAFTVKAEQDYYEVEIGRREDKKAKLFSTKEPIKIEVSMNGKLNGSYAKDDQDKNISLEGTVMIEIEAKPSKPFEKNLCATPPIVVAVDVTGKADTSATGRFDLTFTAEGKRKFEAAAALAIALELEFDVTAGFGIAEVVSVGPYGIITGKFDMNILPRVFVKKIVIEGEAGVRAKFLTYKLDFSMIKGCHTCYDRKKEDADKELFKQAGLPVREKRQKQAEFTDEITDMTNYTEDTTRLAIDTSGWLGETDRKVAPDSIVTLQQTAFSDIQPKMITCKDTTMMVYTDIDTDKSLEDRSTLVYSIYDSTTDSWSEPKKVCNSATADYYPDVYTDGEDIYIAWSGAKTSLQGTSGLSETIAQMEVKAAKYDAESDTFVSLGTVTDNETYENAIKMTVADGKPVVVWTENSAGDIFGLKGSNTIHKAVYENKSWVEETLVTEQGIITSIDAGQMEEDEVIAYTVDTDSDLATTEDEQVKAIPLSQKNTDTTEAAFGVFTIGKTAKVIAEGAARNAELVNFAGKKVLCWYKDGNIYYVGSTKNVAQRMFEQDNFNADTYQFISDGKAGSIVYTTTRDNTSQAYLLHYDRNLGKWGSAVALTEQDDYIMDVDGAYHNGQLVLAFNQKKVTVNSESEEQISSEDNSLCWMKVSGQAKVAVQDIDYDSTEVIPGGTVTLDITAVNQGTGTANSMKVSVLDKTDKVLAESIIDKTTQSGAQVNFEVSFDLPYTLELEDYKVVIAAEDGERTEYTLPLGYADLEVTRRLLVDQNDIYTVEAIVENKGIAKAGGMISFYNFNDAEEELYTEDIEPLNYGEKKVIKYQVNPSLYSQLSSYDVAVKVITEEKQSDTYNDFTLATILNQKGAVPNRVIFNYQLDGYECITRYTDETGHAAFPENPVREGYTFAGWFAEETQYTEASVIPTNITLTAKWIKNDSLLTDQVIDNNSNIDGALTQNPPQATETESPKQDEDVTTISLPKENAKYTIGKYTYKVTNSTEEKKTVTLIKAKKSIKTASIPATVKIEGYTYKVTAIGARAFKGNQGLTRVVIGKNVTAIGKEAFCGCKNLKKIIVKGKPISKIGKNAWKGVKKSVVKKAYF